MQIQQKTIISDIIFSNHQQVQVGIQQYLYNASPIPGLLKYLISDFVVNQIQPNGKVVTFSEKPGQPQINKKQNNKKHKTELTQQELHKDFEINEEKKIKLIQYIGQQGYIKIKQLYQKLQTKEKISTWQYAFEGKGSKAERTQLHNFVRNELPYLDSRTQNGKITITYSKSFKKVKKNGQFIHFKLFKQNIDTMGAIFRLSKILGITQKMFGTAGLKDKRGITTQKVSIYNAQIQLFDKFYNAAYKNRQIWIGQFQQNLQKGLSMGQLYGNRFGMVIRFIDLRHNIIKDLQYNLKMLSQRGFINYFGMQRFGRGKGSQKTHQIGIQILKKSWKQVIQNLLLQQCMDNSINELKRDLYQKKQYKRAQRQIPNKYQIEKNLFRGLAKHGQNYSVVFQSLPRSSRMIYGHALQSFLWNKAASERIRKFGYKILVGDLVAKAAKQKITEEIQQKQYIDEDQVVQEEVVIEDYQVQLVNEENIANYTLDDVVIPIYGARTIIPEQAIVRSIFQKLLEKLDLTLQSFIKGLPKSLYLQGGYRKLLGKPIDLSYNFTNYKNKNQQLQNGFYYLEEEKDNKQGSFFALRIRFNLFKSSYATMLTRELLKLPSSFQVQQILNIKYRSLKQQDISINQQKEHIQKQLDKINENQCKNNLKLNQGQ